MDTFDQFFSRLTDRKQPHDWQRELAHHAECGNRLIRIPTGFGKTLGVLITWVWHRVHHRREDWPRRLIWCLPMRVLVEQTEREARQALKRLGVLWNGKGSHQGKVGIHLLMGGANSGRWHLYPESEAVLVGTQDMLLSRAMNRGYASPRARWPMEFGLLNQDALWVMDEVQLMDVGLATSAQLQAFRAEDRSSKKSVRPCFTWWMSATLQSEWMEKSPDTVRLSGELKQSAHRIAPESRAGPIWDRNSKTLEIAKCADSKDLAQTVSKHHQSNGGGSEGPTLVVLNTVERAVAVWKALRSDNALKRTGADVRLAHSRFRPTERRTWSAKFLNRHASGPHTNRIIVSTQVVEAGVDVSAHLLVTELAPWPSMVQRFGRCARWGGEGRVIVADFEHDTDKKSAPYFSDELSAARDACRSLRDVAPIHIERFEEENETLLARLYPYEPKHLLLRHELNELFDTSPDLSGADIDISRFIRSGEERDVQVFWAEIECADPPTNMKPTRDELCSVPFLKAREWLCKPKKSENLKEDFRAWVWDWSGRGWRIAKRRDMYPGQTILVDSKVGGYCRNSGWDQESREPVKPVGSSDDSKWATRPCWVKDNGGWQPSEQRVRAFLPEDHADDAEDDESLSATHGWQTIASHGLQVGVEVERIAAAIAPKQAKLLHLAGRWHDLGKAHPAFQGSIQADDRPKRDDIAKAPDIAWPCSASNMYRIDATDRRPGFRHELASTLGLFGVLQRHNPQHQALLGPWRDLFRAMGNTAADGGSADRAETGEPTAIEREILDLSADEFDLLAYIVCAHHGKVRMAWHTSAADQKADDAALRIRGVRKGDALPPVALADAVGGFHQLPATALDLSPSESGLNPRTGRSWAERVLNLVERVGPFTLAWLEALLRAADQRASRQQNEDRLLLKEENENVGQRMERSHQTLAEASDGGAAAPSLGGPSPTSRQLHGYGRRTGGRGLDSGTTRPPHSATRYIETVVGILSYRELAPLLADRVTKTGVAISNRSLANRPVQDLLLELHRRICEDLTPEIAGRWRLHDVRVGTHRPPRHWRVPVLMHNYAADLEERLRGVVGKEDEELVADLVFAEGQLLHIHPFEDFNGRVSRLFLLELLYRLELPAIDPAARSPQEAERYFTALRAYDQRDPRPLTAIWRRRLAQEVTQ